MALSKEAIVPRDGLMTIRDGAGALIASGIYEDGDFGFGPMNAGNVEHVVTKSRGKTVSVRKGMSREVEGSCTFTPVTLADAAAVNPLDLIRVKNSCSTATGTRANTDVIMLEVRFGVERTDYAGTADNLLTAKYTAIDAEFKEGEPGKLSLKMVFHEFADDANSLTLA